MFSAKVALAPEATDAARRHGCSHELVIACIEHYRSHLHAWNSGALYTRIMQLRPGQDPTQLWPPKAYAMPSPTERRAAEAAKRKTQEAENQRIAAEREASENRIARLEDQHGDAIEMLDKQALIDLIRAAEPDNPEFHVKRFVQRGLTATLRMVLLEHLAKA